jgi:uncharacterized protein (TIGR01777 family)
MRVLITGATGLVGTELVKQCKQEGILVNYFTTRKEKIESHPNYAGFYWNPDTNEIDKAAFEGVSVIIHLAGATIAKRWTSQYKKEILKSRIQTAKLLFDSLKNENHSITHFISASGISVYPNSEVNLYTEESDEIDSSFLAKVVIGWEEAANQFREQGMDVALIRTGMVLAKTDGALPKLVKITKLGLGAPIGNGAQWQSWIHIEDIAGIFRFALNNQLEGVYNAVAPSPVTNAKLSRYLANQLDAPLWLPNVPSFLLKLILGEMSVLALEGQLVSSKKIEESGYRFRFSNLELALKDLL